MLATRPLLSGSVTETNTTGTLRDSNCSASDIPEQLILGRHLHRKVGGMGTAQNPIHIRSGSHEDVAHVEPVGNKTAVPGIITKPIDRRDVMFCGKTDYQFPMGRHEGAGHNNQTRI